MGIDSIPVIANGTTPGIVIWILAGLFIRPLKGRRSFCAEGRRLEVHFGDKAPHPSGLWQLLNSSRDCGIPANRMLVTERNMPYCRRLGSYIFMMAFADQEIATLNDRRGHGSEIERK